MSDYGLPLILDEIAEIAGLDVALKLAAHHGGTRVYIPAQAKEGHWLSQLIGFEKAQILCEHFAIDKIGIYITVPMAREAQRRRALIRALENGLSADKAALSAGMHVRSAFRYRRRLKIDPHHKQGSLF